MLLHALVPPVTTEALADIGTASARIPATANAASTFADFIRLSISSGRHAGSV
jgi:hypothetical protein